METEALLLGEVEIVGDILVESGAFVLRDIEMLGDTLGDADVV